MLIFSCTHESEAPLQCSLFINNVQKISDTLPVFFKLLTTCFSNPEQGNKNKVLFQHVFGCFVGFWRFFWLVGGFFGFGFSFVFLCWVWVSFRGRDVGIARIWVFLSVFDI